MQCVADLNQYLDQWCTHYARVARCIINPINRPTAEQMLVPIDETVMGNDCLIEVFSSAKSEAEGLLAKLEDRCRHVGKAVW